MTADLTAAPIEPITLPGHWDAARHMFRNYPVGVDAVFDRFQQSGLLGRAWRRSIYLPLYFLRGGDGWTIRDGEGAMAAILYLRRHERGGVRILHIDDIEVDARYRRTGLAQRLLAFADAAARAEHRTFQTLAVTVNNTPAVTLYRRLGFVDQHNRFLVPVAAWFNATAPAFADPAADVQLRRLTGRAAATSRRAFYRIEVEASMPFFAPALIAHYPPEPPRGFGFVADAFALLHNTRTIGHLDIFSDGDVCRVRLGLAPDLWASPTERAALQAIFAYLRRSACHDFSLTTLSAAHHTALYDGDASLTAAFGLGQTIAQRMLMIKETA